MSRSAEFHRSEAERINRLRQEFAEKVVIPKLKQFLEQAGLPVPSKIELNWDGEPQKLRHAEGRDLET